MDLLVRVTVAALLVLTGTAYVGRTHKLFELASHFRLQYLLAAFACVAISLTLGCWVCAIGSLLALVANLSAVVSFYRGKSTEPNHSGNVPIGILLINVHHGNPAYEACISSLNRHNPDVIVVQEITEAWARALSPLTRQYPFCDVVHRDDGSGIALYSRFIYERIPAATPEGEARPCMLVRLKIGQSKISLLSIHPRAPIRSGHFKKRNDMLAWAAGQMKALESPKICIGDLNSSPWSPYYQELLQQTQLLDVRKGFGLLPSWPTFMGLKAFMIPIDHCLVSSDFSILGVRTGERVGSDHLPLIVELAIAKP